jgi:hypothetical protein
MAPQRCTGSPPPAIDAASELVPAAEFATTIESLPPRPCHKTTARGRHAVLVLRAGLRVGETRR